MANAIHVVPLGIDIAELERLDSQMWDRLYKQDRQHAADGVRVEERGIQCAGICRDAGVVAWMYLRQVNGQRQAVHQHEEDKLRHHAPESPEHRAYKERVVRVATAAGHHADTEVRSPGGRIITDALIDGAEGLRIGWEIQLSTAVANGPKSVRERARKAVDRGITPAWHTDRRDHAQRNDTAWTRSDKLPAEIIAKNGDLRVVSGFRLLNFWKCDSTAFRECPTNGWRRRCGEVHTTPRPRDVLFDDLVRKTAAGLIVPLEYSVGSRVHRFWVPADDRTRYLELAGAPQSIDESPSTALGASTAGPTCRPRERVEVSRTVPVLNWRDRSHVASRPGPCRICGKLAHLLDDDGRHAHKVCVEEEAA